MARISGQRTSLVNPPDQRLAICCPLFFEKSTVHPPERESVSQNETRVKVGRALLLDGNPIVSAARGAHGPPSTGRSESWLPAYDILRDGARVSPLIKDGMSRTERSVRVTPDTICETMRSIFFAKTLGR